MFCKASFALKGKETYLSAYSDKSKRYFARNGVLWICQSLSVEIKLHIATIAEQTLHDVKKPFKGRQGSNTSTSLLSESPDVARETLLCS